MKVLMLNHSDLGGGAARATFRIFQSLKKYGVDVSMLVKTKLSDDPTVFEISSFRKDGVLSRMDAYDTRIKNYYYKNKLKKYNIEPGYFLSNLSSINLSTALQSIDYDIIHLNWVSHEFLNIDMLRTLKKPIVWTLHDCWAFTGICHYFDHCTNYTSSCGSCKLLNSNHTNDLSHKIWYRKNRAYYSCNMHVVSPSHWLGKSASESSLFKKHPSSVIPYPIDFDQFSLQDKETVRLRYNLDVRRKYILFGAMNATGDPRKGFDLLIDALKIVYENSSESDQFELIVFGSTKPIASINEEGIPVRYLDTIQKNEELVCLYNAVDVTVVPSLSENLSLVIMESLSCGTPVVAFDIGGNSDMIEHKKNGYMASPYSVEELASGINWCLDLNHTSQLKRLARQKVLNNFGENEIARQYESIYKGLMGSSHKG